MGNSRSKKRHVELPHGFEDPDASLDDFEIIRTIGHGSFGKVIQVRSPEAVEHV